MKSQRMAGLDLLRIIGVCAVGAGHMWAGPPGGDANIIRLAIYSWQVPLFFYLSGHFWSSGRSLRDELNRRYRSLIVPFLAWTLLLGTALYGVEAFRGENVTLKLERLVWGGGVLEGPFAPYWFLPVLFFSVVLARVLEPFRWWVGWVVAVVGLIAFYLRGSELALVPQDLATSLPCLAFVLAGRELARFVDTRRRTVGIAAASLVASFAVIALGASLPLDLKVGEMGTPIISVVVAIAICWSLTVLFTKVSAGVASSLSRLIVELASAAVVVILTHTFAIAAIRAVSDGWLSTFSPVIFVGGMSVSWAIALVLHRSRVSPVLVGLPRLRTYP